MAVTEVSRATETLRERTRRTIRADIAAAATTLFVEQGFEETTVDQIAVAAGISRRTFFRYFTTKEDVIVGRMADSGAVVRDALSARPDDEPPWQALAQALGGVCANVSRDPQRALRVNRMFLETPSLQARHLEKQLLWQELLVPVLADRLSRQADPGIDRQDVELCSRALVAATLAAMEAAVRTWAAAGGVGDVGQMLRTAMQAVRPDREQVRPPAG